MKTIKPYSSIPYNFFYFCLILRLTKDIKAPIRVRVRVRYSIINYPLSTIQYSTVPHGTVENLSILLVL